MSNQYYDMRFKQRLDHAIEQTRLALQEAKCVELEDSPHAYGDKFAAAEVATRLGLASALAFAELLGLDGSTAAALSAAATAKAAERGAAGAGKLSLRLDASGATTHVGERTRDVVGPTVTVAQETESKGGLFGTSHRKSQTSKTVTTTVEEHLWRRTWTVTIRAFRGAAEVATLLSLDLATVEATRTKDPPRRDPAPVAAHLADADWLVALPRGADVAFAIDRAAADTPRRNADVEDVLKRLRELATFARTVAAAGAPADAARAVRAPVAAARNAVFQPAACVVLAEDAGAGDDATAATLAAGQERELLAHAARTVADATRGLAAAVGAARSAAAEADAAAPNYLLDEQAATALLACGLLEDAHRDLAGALDHLERMLFSQLRAAAGKDLTPDDFEEYMTTHERRLYRPCYRPRALSYSVRRSPDAFPEGSLSLEDPRSRQPVRALSRRLDFGDDRVLRVPVGAATVLECRGETYAHCHVARTFAGARPRPLALVASARQFSSYILVLGTCTASDEFAPRHAIVVQNKDEVLVTLGLDPLPAPKAFRDAIESLSSEQQAFCKAFRQMQLASSLFGILVVQIKPQVEQVLNLPAGALTKEIQLTEDLMQYFLKYQVPTDLLSYDGAAEAPASDKIAAVKAHAAAIKATIDDAEARDLEAKKKAAQAAVYDHIDVGAANYSAAEEEDDCLADSGLLSDMSFGAKSGGAKKSAFGGKGGGGRAAARPAPRSRGGPVPQRCAAPGAPPPPMAMMAKSAMVGMAQSAAPPPPPAAAAPVAAEPAAQLFDDAEKVAGDSAFDVTQLPKRLDASFEALDADAKLRPTTLTVETPWRVTRQASLLSKPETTSYGADRLAEEKRRAFDLLDALTRSGALPLAATTLHVVVAATHAFDRDVVKTVVVDNVDPIVKAERSSLIVASTLFGEAPRALVAPAELGRLALSHAPKLLGGDEDAS